MKALAVIGGTILALILIVVLAVGIWKLNWFVKEKNVNKGGEVAQQSYSRQIGIAAGIDNDTKTIAQIDVQVITAPPEQVPALRAQRAAIIGGVCDAAANLNNTAQVSTAAQTLIAKECK